MSQSLREEGKKGEILGECELRRGHPGNKSMADTFLGTSWTGALPPWLPIGWELPRGMHRSLPMESRGNDLQLSHSGTIVFGLEEKGDGAGM